jgi:hypothetical protein
METDEAPAAEENDADAQPTPEASPLSRGDARYPLAYDSSGNPLTVPSNAVAWRVRRGGGRRGRPKNVFDQGSGRQLEIPLGSTINDLIATNVQKDRYLLYPVDESGTIIPGIVAMTEVQETADGDDDEDAPSDSTADAKFDRLCNVLEKIVVEHKFMMGEHAKALTAAVSGYAPVRAPAPVAPEPVYIESPPPPAPPPPSPTGGILESLVNLKPEQMAQLAMIGQQLFMMIKGIGGSGGAPTGGT